MQLTPYIVLIVEYCTLASLPITAGWRLFCGSQHRIRIVPEAIRTSAGGGPVRSTSYRSCASLSRALRLGHFDLSFPSSKVTFFRRHSAATAATISSTSLARCRCVGTNRMTLRQANPWYPVWYSGSRQSEKGSAQSYRQIPSPD